MLADSNQQLADSKTFFEESVQILYKQGVPAAFGSALSSLFIGLVVLFSTYSWQALLWLIVSLVVSASRTWLAISYTRITHTAITQRRWFRYYWVSVIASGFIWGGLTFLPIGQEDVYIYLLTLMTIAYICTAAMSSFGVSLFIYGSFLLMVFLSAISGIIIQAHSTQAFLLVIGQFILVFVLFLRAKSHRDTLLEMLRQRKVAEDLSQQLQIKQDLQERDNRMARHVFDKITSPIDEKPDGLDFWLVPVADFSGDLLHWNIGSDGSRYLMLCDFTGHGLPAALGAVPTSGVFHAMSEKSKPVETIAEELNKRLSCLLPTEFFCCVLLCKIDPNNTLTIINAGLPDAYIVNQEGGINSKITSNSIPLGIDENLDTQPLLQTIQLLPGDTLHGCSDGLLEAENENGEQWGEARFEECITRKEKEKCQNNIKSVVQKFTHGLKVHDDITLFELRS